MYTILSVYSETMQFNLRSNNILVIYIYFFFSLSLGRSVIFHPVPVLVIGENSLHSSESSLVMPIK